MDPLSITTSIVWVLELAATVVQYFKDVKGGFEDRLKLRAEIRNTSCLLERLKDRAEDADSGKDWGASMRALSIPGGPLEQFKKCLELMAAKLSPASRLKQMTQTLKWPLDRNDVDSILRAIERQKSLYGLAISNDHV